MLQRRELLQEKNKKQIGFVNIQKLQMLTHTESAIQGGNLKYKSPHRSYLSQEHKSNGLYYCILLQPYSL